MTIETIKALITGASGFIGGRIAERLWLDYGVTSNCLIQNYSKAARLARLPVKIHRGNLLEILPNFVSMRVTILGDTDILSEVIWYFIK